MTTSPFVCADTVVVESQQHVHMKLANMNLRPCLTTTDITPPSVCINSYGPMFSADYVLRSRSNAGKIFPQAVGSELLTVRPRCGSPWQTQKDAGDPKV